MGDLVTGSEGSAASQWRMWGGGVHPRSRGRMPMPGFAERSERRGGSRRCCQPCFDNQGSQALGVDTIIALNTSEDVFCSSVCSAKNTKLPKYTHW